MKFLLLLLVPSQKVPFSPEIDLGSKKCAMTTMPAHSNSKKASHADKHRNFLLRAAEAFSADGEADDSDEGDSVARITTDIGRSTLRGVITLFVLRPILFVRVSERD